MHLCHRSVRNRKNSRQLQEKIIEYGNQMPDKPIRGDKDEVKNKSWGDWLINHPAGQSADEYDDYIIEKHVFHAEGIL